MNSHHAAPALGFPVRRVVWVVWALAAWWLLSLTALAWACLQWEGAHRWLAMGLSALLTSALGAWAGWGWYSQVPGEWFWDRTQWHFQPLSAGSLAVPIKRLEVVFDLQHSLLLRAGSEPTPGPWAWLGHPLGHHTRWRLVCRAHAPDRWHDFRCAVYSRA